MEIWVNLDTIPGLEYLSGFSISDAGRIMSYRSNTEGKILKTSIRKGNGSEHEVISLGARKRENIHKFYIHRLVMLAFRYIENHKEMTVDHINGNTFDNRLENLQWMTHGDNIRKSQQGSKTFESIDEVAKEYLTTEVRLIDLAKKYGCSLETIWRTINNSSLENTKKRKTFSIEKRKEIAQDYLSGKTLKEVGTVYNCCESQVSAIVNQYRRGDLNEVT